MRSRRSSTSSAAPLALAVFCAAVAPAGRAPAQVTPAPPPAVQGSLRDNAVTAIQDMVRLEGEGESVLRGTVALVTGLRQTGDSGTELALARPLAQIHTNNGNPIADLRELAKAKSAALVMVSADIPRSGARRDDTFDVIVRTAHSASSIEGGYLELTALTGPYRGDDRVFAMATGPITIDDPRFPTVGRVRGGARMVRDIAMPPIGDEFNLIIEPAFRSWMTAETIASVINDSALTLDEAEMGAEIARATDQATVHVTIPPAERADPSAFISRTLTTRFSPSLLDMPAVVVVNERSGTIVVTADVEISPVAITHGDLIITTAAAPAPPPGAAGAGPSRFTPLYTTGRSSERARIQDLINAFRALDVPPKDQIAIISEIARSGRLHARLVVQ